MAWYTPKVDVAHAKKVLSEAVKLPTVDGENGKPAFDKLYSLFRESFPTLFRYGTVQRVDDDGLIVFVPGAQTGQPFLFIGHLDVAPVEEATVDQWTYPPFSGAIEKDSVWGRGTVDMKGHVIAMLEAAESLLVTGWQPGHEIYFALSNNEEVHGTGAFKMCRILKALGVRPALLLDEGGGVENGLLDVSMRLAKVGICEKGRAHVTLTARGEGGLASRPPKMTAPEKLVHSAAWLKRHPFLPRVCPAVEEMFKAMAPAEPFVKRMLLTYPRFFAPVLCMLYGKSRAGNALTRTLITFSAAHAGTRVTSLPQEAAFQYDCRILPGDTVADIRARFDRAVGKRDIQVTYASLEEPSGQSPVTGQSWEALTTAINLLFPHALVLPCLTSGNTDGRHYEEITDHIYHFSPFALSEEEKSGVHGVNEHLTVKNLQTGIEFFQLLMQA